MAFRTDLALEYLAAPRHRLRAQAVTVGAGSEVDITALVGPTRAECGQAPSWDLFWTAPIEALETGLLGASVTDGAVAPLVPGYPFLNEEEDDGGRVRGLFPRVDEDAAVLTSPFDDETLVNRVYLHNRTNEEVIFAVVAEVPELNFR